MTSIKEMQEQFEQTAAQLADAPKRMEALFAKLATGPSFKDYSTMPDTEAREMVKKGFGAIGEVLVIYGQYIDLLSKTFPLVITAMEEQEKEIENMRKNLIKTVELIMRMIKA